MTNYEIYTLMFSSVVAISTIVYSFLTWKILTESKLLREYQNKPDIAIYFERAEADASFVFIIIENKGMGVAKNVKFKVLRNVSFCEHEKLDFLKKGIIVNGKETFYPGQKFDFFFTDLSQEYETKITEEIVIEVTCRNIFNQKIKNLLTLRLDELVGASTINPPPNYIGKIVYELNQIRRTLNQTANNKLS